MLVLIVKIGQKCCSRKHLILSTMNLLWKLPLNAWKFVHERKLPFLKQFWFPYGEIIIVDVV